MRQGRGRGSTWSRSAILRVSRSVITTRRPTPSGQARLTGSPDEMTSSAGDEDRPARVEVPGGQGVQVGDHGTQHNKYIQTYIETQVVQQSAVPVAGQVMAGAQLPGSVPRAWNIPARNPGFTGRDALLQAVRERLMAGDRAVVQALRGMGGVGKTQLVAEYAHRF